MYIFPTLKFQMARIKFKILAHLSKVVFCVFLSGQKVFNCKTYPLLIQVSTVSAQVLQCTSFIYLFGVLRRFQHCTGHIMTGSQKGRGNQYIQFIRVLYCKLPTNGKQLPAFPHEAVLGTEPRPQRWDARVLPLCQHGPYRV